MKNNYDKFAYIVMQIMLDIFFETPYNSIRKAVATFGFERESYFLCVGKDKKWIQICNN